MACTGIGDDLAAGTVVAALPPGDFESCANKLENKLKLPNRELAGQCRLLAPSTELAG
jgi:hypothetical protein